MGKLSHYLQSRSDKILDDPKFQEALEFYSIKDAIDPGTITSVSDTIAGLIENLLSGRQDNAEILTEIKDEIDQIIYLLREVVDMLRNTVPVSELSHAFINDTIKPRLEEMIETSSAWEGNLRSDSPAVQVNTINIIMQQYIDLQGKTIAAFDCGYAFYDSIALSFLLLAILNNMLRQGPVYINNVAPRFMSYFNRAINVAFSDSLAKKLVALVADSDKIYNGFPPRHISWSDGRTLEIEGDVKNGFTYKQWKTDNTPSQEKSNGGQPGAGPIRFSPVEAPEWIGSYENAHTQFMENLRSIEVLKAAINSCTAYVKVIKKYIADK